ncbi:hypothetical protein GCM10028805_57540 [Spirosoma harenae]
MVVGPSTSWQLLESLASINSMYYYPYAQRTTTTVPYINNTLTLSVSQGDTVLTMARFYPLEAYDVPEGALLQLKFLGERDEDGIIYDLPILRSYHTIHGGLIVRAKAHQYVVQELRRKAIAIVRLNKVSTNQADLLPADWYPSIDYRRAFLKGANLLFTVKSTSRASDPVYEVEPKQKKQATPKTKPKKK